MQSQMRTHNVALRCSVNEREGFTNSQENLRIHYEARCRLGILLDLQLSLIITKGPVILPNAKFPSIPKIKVKRKISIHHKICDFNKSKGNSTVRKNFGSRLELELTLSTHQNQTKPKINLNALPKTKPHTELGQRRRNLLQCRYCKSYKRSQNELAAHERVHTREQPFMCKHCSKRFTWKATWRHHEMIGCEFKKCIPKKQKNTTSNVLTSKASATPTTGITQNQVGPGKNQEEIVDKDSFTRKRRVKTETVRYSYSSDSDVLPCDSDDDIWKGGVSTVSSLKRMRKKSKKDKRIGEEVRSWTPSVQKPLANVMRAHAGAGAQLRSLSTPVRMRKQTVSSSSSSTNGSTKAGGNDWDRKARGHPKAFSCFVCMRKFSLKVTLKVHERTHTGEQPYFCTNCNARFKQVSGLNYHVNKSKKSNCAKTANK